MEFVAPKLYKGLVRYLSDQFGCTLSMLRSARASKSVYFAGGIIHFANLP